LIATDLNSQLPLRDKSSHLRTFAFLILATIVALLIQGYHPGLEDDAFYLAAIKRNLNPALFPHDADFFRLQFQATIFDKVVAASVRLTHLPLGITIFLWQFATTLLILWGCLAIARRCFESPSARWAAVAMVAALLTIPVSGTGISLTDQYLHPRAVATAAILAAIVAILKEERLTAAILLIFAFAMHAIMASFGISFCIFLAWNATKKMGEPPATQGGNRKQPTHFALALLPLAWLFEPASDAWRQAAATRRFYFLGQWTWYEWLGVFAPFALLALFAKIGRRNHSPVLARLASRLLYFAIFQLAVALVVMLPPSLERLRPFEPMRYLQLVYLLMFLMAGGLIGQYVLGKHVYRWLLLFVPLGLGMFYAQRQMYPSTAHLELPGTRPGNDWVAAFDWARQNTPTDSLFALDPYYMSLPAEDYHGFRALAERSALADVIKDAGMAARVPRLAPRWLSEVDATRGWRNFRAPDFQSLHNAFGVNWIVLAQPGVPGMDCPYQNRSVLVCQLVQ
jgi:hypothetical protein